MNKLDRLKGDTVPFNKLDRPPLFPHPYVGYDYREEVRRALAMYSHICFMPFYFPNNWREWIGLNISGKVLSITKLNHLEFHSVSSDDYLKNYCWTGYGQWLDKMERAKKRPVQSQVTASKVPDDLAKESGVNLMPGKNEAATEVDRLKPLVDRQQIEISSPVDRPKVDTLEDWIDYWDGRIAEAKKAGYFDTGNVKADPVEFMRQDPIGGVDRPQLTFNPVTFYQSHPFPGWGDYAKADPESDVDRPETTPMDRPSLTIEAPPHVALSWDDYFSNDPLRLIVKADPSLIVKDEAGTVAGYVKVKDGPLNLKADPSEVATLKLIQPDLVKREGIKRGSLDSGHLTPYSREDLDRLITSEWSTPALVSAFSSTRRPKPGELIWVDASAVEKAKAKADPICESALKRFDKEIEALRKITGFVKVSRPIQQGALNVQTRNREVYADPYEAQEKAG